MSDPPVDDPHDGSSKANELAVGAPDVLRLIQGHLTSVGLHESCRVLRQESGIGAAGVSHAASLLRTWANQGQWALVLQSLTILDRQRCRLDTDLIAAVHEMAILEVAAAGDMEVAYATYRLCQDDLQASLWSAKSKMTRARHVEQKLAALAAARTKDPKAPLPDDYYHGAEGRSREEIRQVLGDALEVAIPQQPGERLTALLQQAIKYQSYTGELPRIKQWWPDDNNDDENDQKDGSGRRKKKRRKVFDLVLGTAHHDPVVAGEMSTARRSENYPTHPTATIKFGKKAVCEAATFLPDGSGLVTGSSDGLIEIWDAKQNYGILRIDLPYQEKEEFLGHDHPVMALDASRDGALLASGDTQGQVCIWRIDTGKCLRTMQCHTQAISCVQFSPDGSHILTASHDGKCREYGLRTSRMLKEFAGHDSYVNTCFYQLHSSNSLPPRVVTSSADGTVRIFDGASADCLRVLRPTHDDPSVPIKEKMSIAMEHATASANSATNNVAIAAVLPLHTQEQQPALIIVPRGSQALLVNYAGVVLKIFQDNTAAGSFCAASANSSNQWLYAVKENGTLCIFEIATGKLQTSVTDFGTTSTKKVKDDASAAEISVILSHPNQNQLAAFSNSKSQKRGQLVVWK
eukprot:CAMPEP_0172450302 /NCGR_PEP_ID=MMETSP1065-20121228/8701_1 /TAXON_ID=265537 /ORGANISM="Amphiprora paludosa, Strain CCMP125" /LENGTH=632 /DNA_ID=CAMNT_0013202081 /DNA_START=59 /DNA_END=1957 /DNA_ORIENTATION=+